jgi:hypothetical protein
MTIVRKSRVMAIPGHFPSQSHPLITPPPDYNMSLSIALIIAAASGVVLAVAPGTAGASADVSRWVGITLGGSIFASAIAFFLNPHPDDPRKVVGRAAASFICGVSGPRLLIYFVPAAGKDPDGFWQTIATFLVSDPIILFVAGVAFAGAGYILSASLVAKAFHRAPTWSDKIIDRYTHDDDNDDHHNGSSNGTTLPTPRHH